MYLVTGATGFLGKHLVDALVRRGPVRCVVRAGSGERFDALNASRWGGRAQRIEGDLAQELLGLDPADLVGVEHVVHCAALYDLRADEAACLGANVDGTAHALALAGALDASFQHISTIAVAGDAEGAFSEDDFDRGQSHGHPYPASKFAAEALVRAHRGPWRIYRPGMIVGSSQTGAADKADGIALLFPLIRGLRGALPSWVPLIGYEGAPLPLAPVDFVAEAIDHLLHQPDLDGRTFHLVDPAPPTFGQAANLVAAAAHAPRFAFRITPALFESFPVVLPILRGLPMVRRARERLLGGSEGGPMLRLLSGSTRIESADTWELLRAGDVTCPPFASYAWRLWDHWDRVLRPADLRTLRDAVHGRVVVVTGASSGIGEEVARVLAAEGAHAVLVARSTDKLESLATEIREAGGTATPLSCDIADPRSVAALVAAVEGLGGCDVLVNNAGRSIRRAVAQSRFHDFERTMQLNYFGALSLILGFLPGMRARGRGHIVNVLSMGLQTKVPKYAAYIASKAALEAASASIHAEVLHDGVKFTAVYMPLVRTPMIAPSAVYETWPAMEVGEAAAMVSEALTTQKPRVSTSLGTLSMLWGLLAPEAGLKVLNRGSRMVPEEGEEPTEGKSSGIVGKILRSVTY